MMQELTGGIFKKYKKYIRSFIGIIKELGMIIGELMQFLPRRKTFFINLFGVSGFWMSELGFILQLLKDSGWYMVS